MSANSSSEPLEAGQIEEDVDQNEMPDVVEETELPRARDVDYDSDVIPTTEEWKLMKGYGSFITHDESHIEHTFHIGDIIYVLPTGRDPNEEIDQSDLWLAQIRSIRAHSSDSVWLKARWFYHPDELPKGVKGVTRKLKRFGYLERIISNQADFIPTSTCCGHAVITQYDEQKLEQEDIEPGSFYYRYEYDWQKRVLKSNSLPCSICKRGYNPDTDTMHFCPRSGCRRAWHISCLEKANWHFKSADKFLQRIESLDGDYSRADSSKPGPKKKARLKEKPEAANTLGDPYARIPVGLLAVARQPIARGGPLGVVGNVRSVVQARTIVQNALRGTEDIPADWEEKLGKVHDASTIGPSAERKGKLGTVLAYQCPKCGEPI